MIGERFCFWRRCRVGLGWWFFFGLGSATGADAQPPPGLQAHPALAAAGSDVFAVWSDTRLASQTRVFWTRLPPAQPDSLASPAASDGTFQLNPAVDAAPGWALAVWEAWGESGVALHGAELPTFGLPQPLPWSEVIPASEVRRPAVSARADRALVLWESGADIFWAVWTAGAGPATSQLLAGGANFQHHPQAATTDQGWVAVWSERAPSAPATIQVKTISSDGAVSPAVHTLTTGSWTDVDPAVSAAPGGFLVAWQENGIVRGQRLLAGGVPDGASFLLADPPGFAHSPQLAFADSVVAVVWVEQEQGGRGIKRARWDGTALAPATGLWAAPPATQAADPALVGYGDTVRVAWREPTAADDDDLYTVVSAAADTVAQPAPTLLTQMRLDAGGLPGDPATVALRVRANPAPPPIRFEGEGWHEVALFSVTGRRVTVLAPIAPGRWAWDGRARDGRPAAPGVYLARYRGKTGGIRFLLLR